MMRKATLDQYLQIGKKMSDGDLDRETVQAIVEGRIRVVPTSVVTGRSLADGEYLVHVDNNMPGIKVVLEVEFSSAGGVSELFCGNYDWQNHSSCAEMDHTPGNRVMLLWCFGRNTTSEANIAEMDKLGYRPATHLEAYAFQKAHPNLQRQFWIVALGSSTLRGDDRYVAVLHSSSGRRILDSNWFGGGWDSHCRFLFVRKDPEPTKAG